ncbi:unnamed protein product [Ectocarpus sp. CCAP 1310/34]|nr:unnamed protein product [Ectocarpus sp. CCAP 1310/34]
MEDYSVLQSRLHCNLGGNLVYCRLDYRTTTVSSARGNPHRHYAERQAMSELVNLLLTTPRAGVIAGNARIYVQ